TGRNRLVGARVTATNNDTGIETSVTTAADGSYTFGSLHVGTNRVSVEASGFKKYESPGNPVVAQKNTTLVVTLVPGSETQRIEVSGAATQVDTAIPTIQATLAQAQLAALPVIGRDAHVTVELTQPGAVITENGNNGSRVRVNGFRG